ncbi:hypothetical protein [Vulcanococcus sp.]|uniref:hypothetical protein n=1 Tax=Vulcanococcus sp. TaxID=2856995 RepID=UPI003F69B482
MDRPDFTGVVHHSRQREPHLKNGIPQGLPPGSRIYTCECCNDTGVVQSWKLNRFALATSDQPLDSTTSLPVFCQQFASCGNTTQQVFAGNRDNDESAPRTMDTNLLKGNSNGDSQLRDRIAKGLIKVLTPQQSRFIHEKVLEHRAMLEGTSQGLQYIADVKTACREALPPPEAHRGVRGLSHIGLLLRVPVLPPEPGQQPAQSVQPPDPGYDTAADFPF